MSQVTYRRKRRPGCFTLLLILIIIGMTFLWLHDRFEGQLIPGKRPNEMAMQYGEDAFPTLSEIWSQGNGDTKVVKIPLTGMIMFGADPGFFGSISSTDLALRSIRRATLDPEVRGIILEIDSGGGGITASDILYHELMLFKEADPNRKIVAICGDIAASGAYYVALAADKIIAHPTSITGSIGVIIQTLNFRELAQKYGVQDVTIKSGKNKDLLNPMGDISEEQLALLQHVVDDMHARFKNRIVAARGLEPESVDALADGRIFTVQQAMDHGLIDQVGYWQQAVNTTREILKQGDLIVYRYEPGFSWRQLLMATTKINPRAWIQNLQTTRLLYQWKMD